MNKKIVWGYSETHTRYIITGVSKKEAIKRIASATQSPINWVANRIAETGNENEIGYANNHKEKLQAFHI